MRVLLTGGSGFIGSYVCRDLVAAGHDVAVLCRGEAPWRIRDCLKEIQLVQGGLDDLDEVWGVIREFSPEAVAHLAWAGVANFDRNNPRQIDNIGWTTRLMRLSRDAGANVFLGLGSQAEYGPKSALISPDAATEPTTLYGEAKLAAGRIGSKLAEIEGMRFIWMRVFSTYGAADNPYWMIPSLIRDLFEGKRPSLTLGQQLWDFLHVADAARAIRLALENEAGRGVYNLGSGNAPSLRSTIEAIRDEIDPSLSLGFGDVPYRPDQVMLLRADIASLTRDLGWSPDVDFRKGVSETVAWYRENRWIYDGR